MSTLNDLVVAGSSDRGKQQLQQALLDLLKGNPDILNSVTTKQATDRNEVPTRSGSDSDRAQRSPSSTFPELENSLNNKPRESYHWQLSDSDDGIDSAWTTTTKNMTPREICRWRRKLFSIYVGHLPYDITKKELVQLFSEVGNVQDVHLQPAKEGGYTYGFIRYLTLDECNDAVSALHGRHLGNKIITVEFASETKEKLLGDGPGDLPLDKKDKLLRSDYPKVERLNRPMSDTESQERMVLWKLRSSVARHISSPGGGMVKDVDTTEQESKELLMSKIQEIVKKVASLPADTFAVSVGSEGSACSSWILEEMNGNFVSGESGQSNLAQYPGKGQAEHRDELSSSASQVRDMPPEETPECSPSLVSSRSQQNFVVDEEQEETQKLNAATFASSPNTQRSEHNHLDTSLSPEREERSQSELETTASDSLSLGSLSPVQPVGQHHHFCHESSPTRGHVSDSSQSETTSSSSQQLPASPCKYCLMEKQVEERKDVGSSLDAKGEGSSQYPCTFFSENVKIGEVGNSGTPSSEQFRNTGLCSFDNSDAYFTNNDDTLKKDWMQTQCLSEVPQMEQAPVQAPVPTRYTNQEQLYRAHQNKGFGQQGSGDTSETRKTHLLQENHQETPYSSEITVQKQLSPQIQHNHQEPMDTSNAASKPLRQYPSYGGAAQSTNAASLKEAQAQSQYLAGTSQKIQSSIPHPYTSHGPESVSDQPNTPYQGPSGPLHVRNTIEQVEGQRQTPYSLQNTRVSQYTNQGLMSSHPYGKNPRSAMEAEKQDVFHPKQQPMPSPTQYYSQEAAPLSDRGNRYRASTQPTLLGYSPYGKKADLPMGVQKQAQCPSIQSQPNSEELQHFTAQENRSLAEQAQLSDSPYGKKPDAPVDDRKTIQHPSHTSQLKQRTMASQHINQESTPFSSQGYRASAQQRLLNDSSNDGNSDVHLNVQQPEVLLPKEHSPPSQYPSHFANQANQHFGQQRLLGFPASLLGYPPHVQAAVMANIAASGWQHAGFPRHPFLPPSPMNPGIFQGWSGNPLMQQQLLASGLPFGSPFHARGHQPCPRMSFRGRGSTPRPGQGCRVPFVETQDQVRRGRTFAPRFPGPGVQTISADIDSKKFVPGVSSVEHSEMINDKARQSGGNDLLQWSVKSLTTSCEGANLESPNNESEGVKSGVAGNIEDNNAMRSGTDTCSQDYVKGLLRTQSSPSGNSKESNTKLSATPSPEKAELKRIQRENERLRQCIDWNKPGAAADNALTKEKREALKSQIHLKEVQLQKEREMIRARKAEQELLYEREKLEAAFDQQLQRELENERKTSETNSKIRLEKLSNDLLKLYVQLNGIKQLQEEKGTPVRVQDDGQF